MKKNSVVFGPVTLVVLLVIVSMTLKCTDSRDDEPLAGEVTFNSHPMEGFHVRIEGNDESLTITDGDGRFVINPDSDDTKCTIEVLY